jgi:membrane-associated protein
MPTQNRACYHARTLKPPNKRNALETLTQFLSVMLHVDQQLALLTSQYGIYIYAILFLIIFAETGFVVFPFLPGDSLLFIAGALAADGQIDPWALTVLLIGAAILGNTVNYAVGRYFGKRVFETDSRWISRDVLLKAHGFYENHGGKAVLLSRFLPLLRTFVPFIAGVSEMTFAKFQKYNIIGAFVWIVIFIWGGYFFGQAEFTVFGHHIEVKRYLSSIALFGFLAALVPALLGFAFSIFKKRKNAPVEQKNSDG